MINFLMIEKKWQKKWEDARIFEVEIDRKKKKYFLLEMYPYPSSSGLHMGHAFNYIIGDILARYMRMKGYHVLHPMGYDSFGLPAENAAIKAKTHPKIFTEKAIANFIRQQKSFGLSYDWSRRIESHDPGYYRWNQYFFLKFFKKGLVYRKKAQVNWCKQCCTVLANEQVVNGKCWRHEDTLVEIKHLEQWFIKTTAYAEELLRDIERLDWPESIKIMQRNWIGRSEGTEITFNINGDSWPVFTTRPDTLFGVTFLVISAQHPDLIKIVTKEQKKNVETFLRKIRSTKQEDLDTLTKDGVFTGTYAEHPLTHEKIPVWVGNFVVADYGSGVIMAVPAHDQRDFEFAKKYMIPIVRVVSKEHSVVRSYLMGATDIDDKELLHLNIKIIEKTNDGDRKIEIPEKNLKGYEKLIENKLTKGFWNEYIGRNIVFIFKHKNGKIEKIVLTKETETKIDKLAAEFVGETWNKSNVWMWLADNSFYTNLIVHNENGYLENSEDFNDLSTEKAQKRIAQTLVRRKLGKITVQYKLRDWLVSRQRYWGTPIPMVYCGSCGVVPVPEKDLPVLLPTDVTFGKGNPLETNKRFVETICPKCKKKARRETDTMDTFFDSSWYYLRFTDAKNAKKPFDESNVGYWMPVDFYTGGAEHACMHLIYARFFTKVLRDLGYVKFSEPFSRLFNQGMVHKDGFVMSKSRGNVVSPEEVSQKYGIDAARLFLMSIASPDKDTEWSERGIEGSWKFILKIFEYFKYVKIGKSSKKLEHNINKSIQEITENIETVQYSIALIKLRNLFEHLEPEVNKKDLESFLKMLSVFCPHSAEELWEILGHNDFLSSELWPKFDESKINEKFDIIEKTVEQTVSDILSILKIVKEKQGKNGKMIYLYVLPQEIEYYIPEQISRRVGITVNIFVVNDPNKYDPENKSGKTRPGKPAIFVE